MCGVRWICLISIYLLASEAIISQVGAWALFWVKPRDILLGFMDLITAHSELSYWNARMRETCGRHFTVREMRGRRGWNARVSRRMRVSRQLWPCLSDTVTNQFLTAYSQWIRKSRKSHRKFPLGCEIPPSILTNCYYSLPRVECVEGTGGEGAHVLSIEVLLSLKNLFHLTPSSLLNGLSCRVHFC